MGNTINDKLKAENCCGCGACANICMQNAITMKEDEEGFLIPVIDKNKCTNCSLCTKVCPGLNSINKNTSTPNCFAAKANDAIRKVSSSGGVFSLVAEKILSKSGYVCGAAFDKTWNVQHIIVDNSEDLAKLRRSKYVQSDINTCYKQIKKLLNDDKYVLFSGCPCQVAGLYSFLNKEYKKLYTVDILCHGAPSRKVWRKYLDENFNQNEIKNINFRDKDKIGWSCSHCTITKTNNKQIVTDKYTNLFHRAIIMRKSCQDCDYSKLPRPADITLGDFWGISKYKNELNDSKGISLVLLNSEKGKELFKSLELNTAEEINLEQNYNNGHIRYGLKLNTLRTKFFNNFNKLSYNENAKEIEKEIAKLKTISNEQIKKLLPQKNAIYREYYYCKIKSKLVLKKKSRENYKSRAQRLHQKVRAIRDFEQKLRSV